MERITEFFTKRKVLIAIVVSFLVGGVSGYFLNRAPKESQNYSCTVTIWKYNNFDEYFYFVDPEYSEFPEFYVAEKHTEKHGDYVDGDDIVCSVYND